MHPGETPQLALQRLQAELERHRLASGQAHVVHHREVLPGAAAVLAEVPLVHGIKDIGKFRSAVIHDRELRSARNLSRPALESEIYFGLGEVLYTSAGILYPDRRFAVILSPSVEEGRTAEASPWDSGAFYRALCRHVPPPDASTARRDVFLAHTLPPPAYRAYLVDYIATCFRSGQAYLCAEAPVYRDPLGAFCDSFFSRVFEVRFAEPIPLSSWSVEMIFIPRDAGNRESFAFRRSLEQTFSGKRVRTYDEGRRTLQDTVRSWMLDRLIREGRLHAR